jgi:hypothetical protein
MQKVQVQYVPHRECIVLRLEGPVGECNIVKQWMYLRESNGKQKYTVWTK